MAYGLKASSCHPLKCCLGLHPRNIVCIGEHIPAHHFSCCPLLLWRSPICAAYTLVTSLLCILNCMSSNLVEIWSIALASTMFWSRIDCVCCTWFETVFCCELYLLGDCKFINSGGSSSTWDRDGC